MNSMKVSSINGGDFLVKRLINTSYQRDYIAQLSFKNAKFARNLILIASALCQLSAIKSWVRV